MSQSCGHRARSSGGRAAAGEGRLAPASTAERSRLHSQSLGGFILPPLERAPPSWILHKLPWRERMTPALALPPRDAWSLCCAECGCLILPGNAGCVSRASACSIQPPLGAPCWNRSPLRVTYGAARGVEATGAHSARAAPSQAEGHRPAGADPYPLASWGWRGRRHQQVPSA